MREGSVREHNVGDTVESSVDHVSIDKVVQVFKEFTTNKPTGPSDGKLYELG